MMESLARSSEAIDPEPVADDDRFEPRTGEPKTRGNSRDGARS